MKVLFIHGFIRGQGSLSYLEGIASISAVLKKRGHQTCLIYYFNTESYSQIETEILKFHPDIIAFSAVTAIFHEIKKISRLIKKKFPHIFTICGGVHTTLAPEEFSHAYSLDAICLGEGEYALAELADKLQKGKNYYSIKGLWLRKGRKIIKNSNREIIKNLDSLPFPDRDLFVRNGHLWLNSLPYGLNEEKGLEFILSRGCPFNCTYCSNHALKKFYNNFNNSLYVRFKSPKRAIKEIELAVKKYGADFLLFHDDTFTLNRIWLNTFLEYYQKINLPFICNIRADTVDGIIMSKLKNAGCRAVFIGVECGDEYLRKHLLDRRMSNESIINAFRLAKKFNLQTLAFIMMGFPDETPEIFLQTVKLFAHINPNQHFLNIFYPYPKTKLWQICKKRKIIGKQRKNFRERFDTILNIPEFPRKDILYYYRNFMQLVELSRNKGSGIKGIHRRLLLYLLSKPPSNNFYVFCQKIFHFDQGVLNFLKTVVN
ncbi:B12-binding domain-containing radical SAM protein [Patescibacteria group bacterium]|nr:B12-binding domain-containing radical SAM protein [Patescibacteria group bacterium]